MSARVELELCKLVHNKQHFCRLPAVARGAVANLFYLFLSMAPANVFGLKFGGAEFEEEQRRIRAGIGVARAAAAAAAEAASGAAAPL